MRRCFAILLLVLLPLQFSWAAVAAYCGHESVGAATSAGSVNLATSATSAAPPQHLGHHEHQHAAQASVGGEAGPADQGKTAPSGFDFDCGHCHGTCASLPAAAGGLAPLGLALRPAAPPAGAVRTLAQSPPERPQWAALA